MWCKRNPFSHSSQDYIDRRCDCLSYSAEGRHKELREMCGNCCKSCFKDRQPLPE